MTPSSWDILRRVRGGAGDARRRAQLRAAGVTDGQLRASAYRSPHRGVHAAADEPPTVERRIRDVVPLLPPGGVIGGWAAAYLHGARDLDGLVGGRELPVLVCLPPHRRLRPRPGVRLLRSDLGPRTSPRSAASR
ncbi:hypothetical protein [Kineococcus sp. SYSU DK003]|uniref:hypothetical protein n=1 Tax=Kineococcus sp. SYSU DK003 TaxID=3383124 RepID=UPI003D7C7F07